MASLTDLLTAMQNGVTGINALITGAPKFSAFLMGNTYSITDISTAAKSVLTEASSRTSIVFHNPNDALTLMVYPSKDGAGRPLTPTFTSSSRGGGYILLPQNYLALSGNCGTGWNVITSSGTTGVLTVTTA